MSYHALISRTRNSARRRSRPGARQQDDAITLRSARVVSGRRSSTPRVRGDAARISPDRMRLTEESAAPRPDEDGRGGVSGAPEICRELGTSGLPPSRLAVNSLSLPQRRAPAPSLRVVDLNTGFVARLRSLEEARRHRGWHALVDHPAELGLVVPRPLLLGRVESGPPGALLSTWRRDRHRPCSRPGPSCSRAPQLGRGGPRGELARGTRREAQGAGAHTHATISFIGRSLALLD